MKKKVFKTIMCMIGLGAFLLLLGRIGWYELHYITDGTVIEINEDEVFVEDNNGEVWSFYGDGFAVGDGVTLTIDTNGTDLNKYDDIITKVKPIR